MNILYISSFVYRKNSSAAIRNNKLIEGLVAIGHSVDVLTVQYSDEWTDPSLLNNHLRLGVSSTNYNVFSKNSISPNRSRKRIKNYLPKSIYNFVKNVVAFPDVDKKWLEKDLIVEDKYDLIVSSSDTKTSHFLAEKILDEQKITAQWVQIWGDPWASDVNLDFLSRRFVSSSEKRLLRKASKIFYVSELTALEYKDKYPELSDRVHYIARSFYKKILLEPKDRNNSDYTIFYPGSLNENRSIRKLCEKIKSFNLYSHRNINLRICGYQHDNIINCYKQYDFVEFLGSMSIDEVYSEFINTDLLLFVDNGSESTQIPGKIFDYYGTNLPILALVSEGNQKMIDFLNRDERTVIMDKESQQDIGFLLELEKTDQVNEYYSPESVARRFLGEL